MTGTPRPDGRLSGWVLRLVGHRHARWGIPLVAFVLTLPLIRLGYFLDDRIHTYVLSGNNFPGGPHGRWDLYRFADGGPEVQRGIYEGFFPWWTSPELKIGFFRPLASLWRSADHALWGESATMPHLESLLVYAALVGVVLLAYRALGLGAEGAGLAALMFAIDDAHGVPIAWVANRYAILAMLLGISAFWILARSPTRRSSQLVSALVYGSALASGETALGVFGYFAAYAWFAHPEGRRAGLIALLPHLVVVGAWAALYRWLDYGAGGSELYVDPGRDPVRFVVAVFERLPRLVLGQLLGPPSEVWAMLPSSGRVAYAAVGLALATLLVAAIIRLAKGDPRTKVFAWGSLAAALPVCAMVPDDRNLLVVGFGAFGVLAIVVHRAWTASPGARPGLGRRALVGALVVFHLVLAPVLLPMRVFGAVQGLQGFVDRGVAGLPRDEAIRQQILFVLTTPDVLMTNFMFAEALLDGKPTPARGYVLSVQERGTAVVERIDERTYVIRNDLGQNGGPFTPVYRTGAIPVHQPVVTMDVTVEVTAAGPDGLPTEVRYTFEDIDRARWVVWQGRGFVEVPTLAIGEARSFESTSFLEAIR
jgi:hypothetical protein